MTEQEIINILKENKDKGIAYLFLPEDVWNWIGENLNNPRLMYLAPNGQWRLFSETDFDDYDNVVFALPEYYEAKKESKDGWVEFEIKSGVFDYDDRVFDWWDWGCFLNYRKGCNTDKFTAFGGWQYPNSQYWFTTPQFRVGEIGYVTAWDSTKQEPKSAIPTKIRFWREK